MIYQLFFIKCLLFAFYTLVRGVTNEYYFMTQVYIFKALSRAKRFLKLHILFIRKTNYLIN